MKRNPILWIGIAAGMLACVLPSRGGEPAASPSPAKDAAAFQAADTNADGKVTCAEMTAAACREAFARIDRNGDKAVTPEEWAAADKRPGARERFDAIDRNKDAQITFLEFSETARKAADHDRAFTVLDKNADGTLSRDEYSGHPHFKLFSIQF